MRHVKTRCTKLIFFNFIAVSSSLGSPIDLIVAGIAPPASNVISPIFWCFIFRFHFNSFHRTLHTLTCFLPPSCCFLSWFLPVFFPNGDASPAPTYFFSFSKRARMFYLVSLVSHFHLVVHEKM